MTASDRGSRNAPPWRRYLRLRGRDVRADVADELEFHIDMMAARLVAGGMSPDVARSTAREEFGDIERARALCEEIGAQQARRHDLAETLDSIGKDVRFALRSLRHAPGFTTAIVLTLALGIGATTAIFGVVRGVLLRPLPFADPDRLVRIWEVSPQGDTHNVVSMGNFVSWRERSHSFSVLGAHSGAFAVTFAAAGDPIRITTADVTPSVVQVLGVRAALGRTFVPDDDRGDGRSLVLSHRFWTRQFGGDPGVIGSRVFINEQPYTVVGVMPATFEFPSAAVDAWRPVTVDRIDPNERRSHNWAVVGRLAGGTTLATARAEMRTIAGALAREYPEYMNGFGVNVVGMADDVVATVRPLLLILMAGATLLLTVACINIANLLLARAVARRREIAVRAALGATRARLVRQLVTESTVIAVWGGAVGTLLAAGLTRGLLLLAPSDIPRLSAVRIDAAVLAFAVGVTLASGVLSGLAPAFRLLRRGDERRSLHIVLRVAGDRGGSGRHGGLRAALLVGELAISLVLLAGAGLLVRSAARLSAVDYGYNPNGLATAAFDLPRSRYGQSTQFPFYDRLIDDVRQLPTVTGAAGTTEELGSAGAMTFSFAIEGRPSRNVSGREDPQPLRAVAGDYFRVMGIPLERGRVFAATDRANTTPVVIVNESLARAVWQGDDPVGARISFAGPTGPWLEVVGVVGDTRSNAADQDPAPALYLPYAQKTWAWMSWMTLVVRTDGTSDAKSLGVAIRRVAHEIDPRVPVQRVIDLREHYRESIARRRFATMLTGVFATVALILGMVGMYGVLSYGVLQRRREFGIRMALGARASQVTTVVVREALALAAVAVAFGTVLALGLTRLLSNLLYDVSPRDPVTLGSVAAIVGLVALAAAWIPARRATRIDPALTIRDA